MNVLCNNNVYQVGKEKGKESHHTITQCRTFHIYEKCRDALEAAPYGLLLARQRFQIANKNKATPAFSGYIEGQIGIAHSLLNALALLLSHGIGCFYSSLSTNIIDPVRNEERASKAKKDLVLHNGDFGSLVEYVEKLMASPQYTSHPKIDRLEGIILEHFMNINERGGDGDGEATSTRVMVFSQYRDSVTEIVAALQKHAPVIKVMSFVGQSAAGKKGGTKAFTQKDQLEVIEAFTRGNYNTLVSTSIGEEGLDIGDVDLIVCFDTQQSPVRMLQRMGRTGRKRDGKIYVLLSEGKEEDAYSKSQSSYKSVQKVIMSAAWRGWLTSFKTKFGTFAYRFRLVFKMHHLLFNALWILSLAI